MEVLASIIYRKTLLGLCNAVILHMFVNLLQGIGMEVVAYDIQKNPAVEAMGVKYVDLEEALPWADVVSVHVPLLKSTHHFINGDR